MKRIVQIIVAFLPLTFSACNNGTSTLADSPAHQQAGQAADEGFSQGKVNVGTWSGPYAIAQVTAAGANFQFECAHGVTDEPLTVDANGSFSVPGTYTLTGGPVLDASSQHEVVQYSGKIIDDVMTLEVVASGETSQSFAFNYTLTEGATSELEHICTENPPRAE